MGRGIVELLQLAVTVAFAAPVAMLGVQFLGRGESLMGIALLGVAAGMIAIEELFVSPKDVPLALVQKVVGAAAEEPDADPEDS